MINPINCEKNELKQDNETDLEEYQTLINQEKEKLTKEIISFLEENHSNILSTQGWII